MQPKTSARNLRRNQTDAESRLWHRLRNRQFLGNKFRREHPVGSFIVEFCCPDRRLVVELDVGQHATQEEADRARIDEMAAQGYRVMRFWNNEALTDAEAVPQTIAEELNNPHLSPLPGAERE